MVDHKSPTTFLFSIIINNTEGLYDTLNSIRKKNENIRTKQHHTML